MLPILRIIPVGGVLLAIMILVLALSPPDGSHPRTASAIMPARGPLQQIDEHPEWRQFLILAAIRRADEIGRLRDLPDTPVHEDVKEDVQAGARVAGLPVERLDADPEDTTGSITELPGATIPIDIGETSSTELPTAAPEEKPPVIKPRRVKMPNESRKKPAYRARQAKAAKQQPAAPLNIFELLFGGLTNRQVSTANQAANQQVTGRTDAPAR